MLLLIVLRFISSLENVLYYRTCSLASLVICCLASIYGDRYQAALTARFQIDCKCFGSRLLQIEEVNRMSDHLMSIQAFTYDPKL